MLLDYETKDSLKASSNLIKKHRKNFIKDFFIAGAVRIAIVVLAISSLVAILLSLTYFANLTGEATLDNIMKIHDNGKKAIVWTVNTKSSMKRFIHTPVDGIITDYVVALKNEIRKSEKRSNVEIIIDEVFGYE